jgi:toxin HigB-1
LLVSGASAAALPSNITLDVTRNNRYSIAVILSYRDNRTRRFAAGKPVKAFSGFERPARLKLDRLEAATSLRDLAMLPGNRFEALAGGRKGQYSIRINDQWRIASNGRTDHWGRRTSKLWTITRRKLWR